MTKKLQTHNKHMQPTIVLHQMSPWQDYVFLYFRN